MAFLKRLKDWASTSNTVASFFGRVWEIAKWLEIDGFLKFLFFLAMTSVIGVVHEYLGKMPWWLMISIALLIAVSLTNLFIRIRLAWSVLGIKKFEIGQFADECLSFYRDFSSFMVQRQDARPDRAGPSPERDAHAEWQRGVNFSNKTNALMFERFAARAFAIAHQMKELGIPSPNMFHFPHGDHGGVSVYVGVVGELLRKGLLEEAKKLDPKTMWGATLYV